MILIVIIVVILVIVVIVMVIIIPLNIKSPLADILMIRSWSSLRLTYLGYLFTSDSFDRPTGPSSEY